MKFQLRDKAKTRAALDSEIHNYVADIELLKKQLKVAKESGEMVEVKHISSHITSANQVLSILLEEREGA